MATYRKRPVEIQAIRWTGENWQEIAAAFGWSGLQHDPDAHSLIVATLEGRMRCTAGDWLIKGVEGELYPCRDSIFRETYDAVPDGDAQASLVH